MSTTGQGGESSGTEIAAAVTGPDSTVVEDSDIATQVEVNAVGIANVELYGKIDGIVEAFE